MHAHQRLFRYISAKIQKNFSASKMSRLMTIDVGTWQIKLICNSEIFMEVNVNVISIKDIEDRNTPTTSPTAKTSRDIVSM